MLFQGQGATTELHKRHVLHKQIFVLAQQRAGAKLVLVFLALSQLLEAVETEHKLGTGSIPEIIDQISVSLEGNNVLMFSCVFCRLPGVPHYTEEGYLLITALTSNLENTQLCEVYVPTSVMALCPEQVSL